MIEQKQELTEEQIILLEEVESKKKLRCVKCKSLITYTLLDGTKVCRRCGFRDTSNQREMPKKEKKKPKKKEVPDKITEELKEDIK